MKAPYLTLGIDPGATTAYSLVMFDPDGAPPELMDHGVVKLTGAVGARLLFLGDYIRQLLWDVLEQKKGTGIFLGVCVEEPPAVRFKTKSGGTAINISTFRTLCEYAGVITYMLETIKVPYVEENNMTIKKAVIGTGRAKKPEVAACMRMRLLIPKDESLSYDESDATMFALYAYRVFGKERHDKV